MIRLLVAAAAGASIPVPAAAQVGDDPALGGLRVVSEARLPELTGAQDDSAPAVRRSAFSLVGASDATSVSLTLSEAERVLTQNGEGFGAITIKAPLASSGDEGTFLTEQGIASKASAEVAYTWILSDLSFGTVAPAGSVAIQVLKACEAEVEANPAYEALRADSQNTLEQLQTTFKQKKCKPFGNVSKLTKDELSQLTAEQLTALRAVQKELDEQAIYIINLNASFGYKKFDYLKLSDFAEEKAKRHPFSVSVSGGVNPGKDKPFFGVGYLYKREFKEGEKRVICPVPPPGAPQVECKNAIFDLPKRNVDHTLFGLVRTSNMFGLITHKVGKWAPMFELKIGYDFEDKVFGASAPLYLFLDKDKSFKGGIRVSWQEAAKGEAEDKLKAAFFIVKSFDYFGF